MDVKYNFPGAIDIDLDESDLVALQERGYSVDRAGFAGMESKTWVHLSPIDVERESDVHDNSADIEDGGDLHVRLSRGFLPPVVIEQSRISASDGVVEHYLGRSGIISVNITRGRR